MWQQRPFRRAMPLFLSAVAVASAMMTPANVAIAQVIMGLPDDRSYTGTDKPEAADAVKSGMATIRHLVLDAHSLITHRRMAPDQARRLSTGIKQAIATLKSDPAAPALAEVLTLLDDGATQIAAPISGDGQLEALAKFEIALARYPQLFDDPTWQPLR